MQSIERSPLAPEDFVAAEVKRIRQRSNHEREDLIAVEEVLLNEAMSLVDSVGRDLFKFVEFAGKSNEEQRALVPGLCETHLISLHSSIALFAIRYICKYDETLAKMASLSPAVAPDGVALPDYFLYRLAAEVDQHHAANIFSNATEIVERSGYRLAQVLVEVEKARYTPTALNAIRYACYMERRLLKKRFVTEEGSRIRVLGHAAP